MTPPRLPTKAATTRRLPVTGRELQAFDIPAWGYLEGLEVRPLVELPNMEAGAPYRLEALLRDANGQPIPIEVLALVRDVHND